MTIQATYDSHLVEDMCELHYSCGGFWTKDTLERFFASLSDTLMPLLKARKPYYSVGDFTEAMPVDRETAELIASNLETAVKFGLRKTAIINASPLMKMQYRRVAKDVEVEFFDNKVDALHWIRAGR